MVTETALRFDPWGPVSAILYGIDNADVVEDIMARTGVEIDLTLSTRERYSHTTRIRAMRQRIAAAYRDLRTEDKGRFVQIVVKTILQRPDGSLRRTQLLDAFRDIGWTITGVGLLQTEDALISEAFFPPNSEFDAYTAISEILATANTALDIVDPYIGPQLLITLRGLDPRPLKVRLLTVEKNLRPDFAQALRAFRSQLSHVALEVRSKPDFHDRFIIVDESRVYHVGASLKDAGTRAFMINRLQDQAIVEGVRTEIGRSWNAATPI